VKTDTGSPKIQRQEVVITRSFDAPRRLVWKAWTEPDLFAQWYGLSNSSLSDVKMDVKAGGGWSTIMHIPNAPDISWEADYKEVAELERLAFALRNPDNHEDPNREIVTVTFEELDGKTQMVFNQAGNLPPEQYKTALKQGWNSFFNRMDALLKTIETKTQFKTIDEYIQSFPENVQVILEKIRQTIRKAAPEATEAIGYQMPAFKLNGNLVWFAAFKNHIGVYPIPSGLKAFKEEVSPYVAGKGTLRFPLDKPVPYDLIEKIVMFRVKENLAKKKKYYTRRRKQ
jgi:uncharacterized protein YdhG (YjbR/CyaY superfamily)/uncharacterized protein YndB with AHSA1/START domain